MRTFDLAFAIAVASSVVACGSQRSTASGEDVGRAAQASTTCTGGWDVVPSPNLGSQDNALGAVAGSGPSDVWAVGLYVQDSQPDFTQTLTQHFDGSAWSVVPSPNVGDQGNTLFAVTAAGSEAFATGYFIDAERSPRGLVLAWDGAAWSAVDHPHAGEADWLYSVSAVSASDVWAVGATRDEDGVFHTLTEHFDGRGWSIVRSPDPGENGDVLYGVAARAADDVWAVGQRVDDHGPDRALVLHFNGERWHVVRTPHGGDSSVLLYSVAGAASGALRTVGVTSTLEGSGTFAASERHQGWKVVPSADVAEVANFLYSVTGGSAAWAVGTTIDKASGNNLTLIEEESSSGWAQVTSPNPSSGGNNILGGVARVGDRDVWAVGTYDGANARQTLVLHHCE